MVKTSLGILLLLCLAKAELNKLPEDFDQLCKALNCNPLKETCQFDDNCYDRNPIELSQCVFCTAKQTQKTLLAKSPGAKLLAENRAISSNSKNNSSSNIFPSKKSNSTSDEGNYDDYYEYDGDETSDKNDLGEEDDYLDDYAETIDKVFSDVDRIRKEGVCSQILSSNVRCDDSILVQSDCRFDTDCPNDEKCCETACSKRVCTKPIPASFSVCPTSFTCSLNCRLGYRTDENGCLLCQCQTCQPMDQCQKNCPTGYLKDLFGCSICECDDPCPPLDCNTTCPMDVGFVKGEDGCPLCQCATASKVHQTNLDRITSCQDDVHCPPGFRCLNDAQNVPMCQAVDPIPPAAQANPNCPDNLLAGCKVQCANGVYATDYAGCSVCACPSEESQQRPIECPMMKCRSNCDDAGYQTDENGCQTCQCVNPPKVAETRECSRVMCRMFCVHGFSRDENGCEVCRCNSSPQPCPQLNCQNDCPNGFRKDYSGCQTCSCEEKIVQIPTDDGCSPMKCDLNCKYGYERDQSGCQLCSCNRCPLQQCRMFCIYGFKKNSDGCEICECDWAPVAEKIACSERVPCQRNRVCNLDLQLCETVAEDKINWFVYKFNVQTGLFHDRDFVETFKRGLINNIASKYDLEVGQITVSSVETDGTTSFQIMPYYRENLEDFQRKIDQIDLDLNTNEFTKVIPSVVSTINKHSGSKLVRYFQERPGRLFMVVMFSLGLVAAGLFGILCIIRRTDRRFKHRSDSKLPIYETSYHQAPTEDDHYHAVHAPDGTAYVVVESDEMNPSNEKRAIV